MEHFPREMPLTAAAAEHFIPIPFHCPMYPLQGSEIPGNTIVGVVTSQHSVEIDHLFPYWQVPHPPHQVTELGKPALESRFLSSHSYLKVALKITRAIQSEAQKIDSLWTPPPSLRRMSLGKSPEFDQPGLGWFQRKSELSQPFT